MADPAVQPCKVALRSCTIKGVNVKPYVQGISVFETMCKPYISATITMNDSGNIINNLQLRGGEQVTFAIYSGFDTYESTQYILAIDETEVQDNFRSMIYSIRTATESFFNDRASIVQRSDVNIPSTAAAAAIHSEYVGGDAGLEIPVPSMGLIAKTESGGYVTSNKKPFKAIEDILSRCSYGGFKTGSTVYFRARNSYVMAPLEYLFASMSAQEVFEQRQTWGENWQDTFGNHSASLSTYNAIIHASTKIDEDKQRGAAGNIAAASKGMLNVFDVNLGKEVVMLGGTSAPAFGAISAAASKFSRGRMGGLPNVKQMDSRRNEPSNDQSLNTVAENMFQAQVKDSVNYFIKVPIQKGFNVTVGKGVEAHLLPPIGDLDKNKFNTVGGLMLVADVNHECYFDDRAVQATTIMRAVQLKYNS